MTRIQLACWCLLASSFVLAGILLNRLDGGLASQARADLVVNRDNFTFMTARSSQNAEAIFVLDNFSEKLLVYEANIGRKQLEITGVFDLTQAGGPVPAGERRRGRR